MQILWNNYIVTNPEILYGKPILKNTRIPVDLILERLSQGETIQQLIDAYPNISEEYVYACLSYATSLLRNETVYSIAS